jgi:hypothetical protein
LATLAGPVTLTEDAALVVAALEAGATPHARRRARWLPRTTWGMLTRR